MKPEIFYTKEGKAYVLRSVSKREFSLVSAGTNVAPSAAINRGTASASPLIIDVTTTKGIIPVQLTLSFVTSVGGVVAANISSVYYASLQLPNPPKTIIGQGGFLKLIPYTERQFYNNDYLYAYSVKHNQVVFSDEDFIIGGGDVSVFFVPDLAHALTGNIVGSFNSIPADTYDTSITFLYYEML